MANQFSDAPDSSRSGLLAQMPDGDNAPPVSVSEISNMLKRTVEQQFGHVRIRGEISGFKRAASGHVYLALKDEKALIDGVIWKGNAARIAFNAEDGLDVVATGKLTTFPGRSKYQIVIESLELAGEGALMQLFEKLKARLAGEGLFDAARKQALPYLPRTIGVVTSPTGSVIRDILHRLADRFPSHVIVWPVLVQGDGAAAQIANAVRGFAGMARDNPDRPDLVPDLLIVARGGGSIEDLWAFNEEIVVRAIANCPIPLISAVGHETDTTLSDFAADRRAPTPTAAAEMAVPVRAELRGVLDELQLRGERASRRVLAHATERLEARVIRLPKLTEILQPQQQRTDDLGERLRQALGLRLAKAGGELARTAGSLRPAMLENQHKVARQRLRQVRLVPALLERSKQRADEKLAGLERLLSQLRPDKPLERGFARIIDAEGHTLTDRKQASVHQSLTVKFRDGDLNVVNMSGSKPAAAPNKPAKPANKKAADQFKLL